MISFLQTVSGNSLQKNHCLRVEHFHPKTKTVGDIRLALFTDAKYILVCIWDILLMENFHRTRHIRTFRPSLDHGDVKVPGQSSSGGDYQRTDVLIGEARAYSLKIKFSSLNSRHKI